MTKSWKTFFPVRKKSGENNCRNTWQSIFKKLKSVFKMLFSFYPTRLDESRNPPWWTSSYALADSFMRLGVLVGSPRLGLCLFSIYMEVGVSTLHPIHLGSILSSISFIFVIRTTVGRKGIGSIHCFMSTRSFTALRSALDDNERNFQKIFHFIERWIGWRVRE